MMAGGSERRNHILITNLVDRITEGTYRIADVPTQGK